LLGAGIVHQYIDAAQYSGCVLHPFAAARNHGNIHDKREGPATGRFDVFDGGSEAFSGAGGYGHIGTRPGEAQGYRSTDAAARAGDKGALASKTKGRGFEIHRAKTCRAR
jgi:hypothetical protein